MTLQFSLPLNDEDEDGDTQGGLIKEVFWTRGNFVFRRVTAGDCSAVTSLRLPGVASRVVDPIKLKYWWEFHQLRGLEPIKGRDGSSELRIADFFCGCGGFALGMSRAAQAVGMTPRFVLAADTDPIALRVFHQNLHAMRVLEENLWPLLHFQVSPSNGTVKFTGEPRLLHPALRSLVGQVDLVIGGPPCQGHSNSNNLTRRNDPRNLLYLVPLVIGIAIRARAVIIENVPEVARDRFARVTQVARQLALSCGYKCDEMIVNSLDVGVPQTRRRHIFVASKEGQPALDLAVNAIRVPPRAIEFAIRDLAHKTSKTPFDTPRQISDENRRRIDYLFKNKIFDLPNEARPDCHKNGTTYTSVYGRLRWDLPAGTITTGFMTPGQGRYIHPQERRPLTPHEGARIQGFSDSFSFELPAEKQFNMTYSKLIGDAVPPQVGYLAGLAALATLQSTNAN